MKTTKELVQQEDKLQYEINRSNSVMFQMIDEGYRFVLSDRGKRIGWVKLDNDKVIIPS
jgi:hypothetical protein